MIQNILKEIKVKPTGFKNCSIRLANFLKKFNDELGESEDDSYLSGLFFRLPT